jgi:predicted KAP-like P-loop ATPase
VGIYGEWGTGKTSVLEFITSIAKHDEQILIRFNPWQHSTKGALWRAFVLAIFSEPALADVAGGTRARAKGMALLDFEACWRS